jgi:hypothetical protein
MSMVTNSIDRRPRRPTTRPAIGGRRQLHGDRYARGAAHAAGPPAESDAMASVAVE